VVASVMYYFYNRQKTVSNMVFQSKVLAVCVAISFVSLLILVISLTPQDQDSMEGYKSFIYR